MGLEAAVAQAGQRVVRAAAAVAEDRGAHAGVLLDALVAALVLLLDELGLRADVDAPAGEAGGETGVLALAADRQRELVVGHGSRSPGGSRRRRAPRARGAGLRALATNRAGSSLKGMMSIFSPRSSETTMRTRDPRGPTHAPTGSTPSAWETTAIFARYSRLTGDVGDLDEAVGDLGHLEREELADQLGVAARQR